MALIAPSMLSADFLHLEEDCRFVNEHADIYHLDVMDGVFVPNISYGFPVIESIAKVATLPMDSHLMIIDPEKYVERFAEVGSSYISFHLNATRKDPREVTRLIQAKGAKAGIAINPDIPVESLFPYIADCDFLLIMSVFAGFGGQKFIEDTYKRVEMLKNEIVKQNSSCLIEVDGGVSAANAGALASAGADMLVAGSSIFKAADRAAVIRQMRG